MERSSLSNDQSQILLGNFDTTSDENLEGQDIDQLINKAGGFGRFQWLILLFASVAYSGVNFYIYNLAYLQLVPALKCLYTGEKDIVDCHNSKDVCDKKLVQEYHPNFNDKESLHNWMTEQKLYCESSFMIGLFGSLFFLGFAMHGIFLKQSDIFGRKAILISGTFVQIIVCYSLYFSNNYVAYYIILFIAGISKAKDILIYIYVTECMPLGKQVYPGAYCLTIDGLIPVMICSLYFYFGGKEWKIPMIPSLILPFITFFFSFLIPESPRYLYAKKDWKGLRKSLSTISRCNGVSMNQYFIDEEVKLRSSNGKVRTALEQHETVTTLESPKLKEKEFSVISALKNRDILINLIVLLISLSSVSLNSYMVSFYLKYVGGNIFINTISLIMSQSIGNFAGGSIQRCVGTKYGLALCFILSAIFGSPLIFVSKEIFIATSVFLSMFFMEGAFCLVFYINPEMFPPLFVPFSFSVSGIVGRIVTIAAPQIAEIKPKQVPIFIFLTICVVSTISALFLRKPKKQAPISDL